MTSLAAVMSNPVRRGTPFLGPPRPISMSRKARSFMSMTRRQVIVSASSCSGLSSSREVSTKAASKLLAAVTA